MSLHTPVVFMVFNRPEPTRRVLETIRSVRPPRLLVIGDGPRPHVPTDAARVAEVRRIIETGIDWPCELLTHYAPVNMGCRERVASGLNWAFSQIEEAIVLEDDTLPDPSFFPFCEEMLERYRDDERVMHIGGTNFAAGHLRTGASYWFSRHISIWGWATWRRAWRHYDLEMSTWEARSAAFRSSFSSPWELHFLLPYFEQTRAGEINTWDFSWAYTCRSLHGMCIVPTRNLVENIGIGEDSTHTCSACTHLHLQASATGPIRHPDQIEWNRLGDEFFTMGWGGQCLGPVGKLRARLRVLREKLRSRDFASQSALLPHPVKP